MIAKNYLPFLQKLSAVETIPPSWVQTLSDQVQQALSPLKNREIPHWETIIESLPVIQPSHLVLDADVIQIGHKEDASPEAFKQLTSLLKELHPWRKGPISFFGLFIDTEWRSDMKWNRLKSQIEPLKDRVVLDVGSGNGYFCWRMRGQGARLVMGIDPYLKYVYQFAAMQHYINDPVVQVLPLGIDDLPDHLQSFDTVFSMGVLYHRRSPFDHLFKLKSLLRPGGQLVLETLVIEGEEGQVWVPRRRYAKMRNVWFIPSPPTLKQWLERAGFKEVRLLDVSITTFAEQRKTEWMRFESLEDFLDAQNPQWTIEGYPRPRRAIFLANRP